MKHENNSLKDTPISLPSMTGLQAFEAAARSASYAAAAQELGRTPSAISHAIKDLETRLGTPLFERAGRNVKLTRDGAEYLASVQGALEALKMATQSLLHKGEDNVVRISALPFFTSAVLLPNLSQFEADNPKLDLRIETSNAYADILNGEADIAIRFGKDHSQNLFCKPLIEVLGQPIAAPSYLDSRPSINQTKDLEAHTLIHVRANVNAWQAWGETNGAQGLCGQQALVFDSIIGAIDAAKSGSGIALTMAPLIESYPGHGTDFVPVLTPQKTSGAAYHFICRKNAAQDYKIRRVLNWLESAIRNQAR